MSDPTAQPAGPKPKKSVALSGVAAGNTALCTVGRTGNDLAYRGYDILALAETCEFEEVAHLLVHGKLPTVAELAAYKAKLRALRGVHTLEYLESLRSPEVLTPVMGSEILPAQVDRLVAFQRLQTGGTMLATQLALARKTAAVNLGGGFHHASAGLRLRGSTQKKRAAGGCRATLSETGKRPWGACR